MSDFTTSGFFVLRTPLFAFEEFLALSRDLSAFTMLGEDEKLAAAMAADRKLVRSRLQEFVRRPEVQEALWMASPNCFQSLALWWKGHDSEKGRTLEQSLYRYVARMTSRPTPFGLFAGCSVGKIGNEMRLELEARDAFWRRSRLDMEYLCNLAEKIVTDPALRKDIVFHPNTSLYLAAGRYHHVQGYFVEEARAYRLVATDFTPYLAASLQRAASGATPTALAAALVEDDAEITMAEAERYIGQLIDSQVLVSELVPPITGPEPIDHMLSQLERAGASSLTAALSTVSGHLRGLDEKPLGNEPAAYQQMVNVVAQLPATYKLEHLVQVDMMKASPHACLDQRFIEEVLRAVEALHSIHAVPQQEHFKQFKEDFRERYQDQETPLVLALDEEVGIGFERKDQPGTKRPSFYFQGATGPSGAILLGRFCHADAAMTHLVQEHLRAEEQLRKDRNAVFAEIAHLPEGRIGNVLFRPILRQYEIPYL